MCCNTKNERHEFLTQRELSINPSSQGKNAQLWHLMDNIHYYDQRLVNIRGRFGSQDARASKILPDSESSISQLSVLPFV